MHDWPNLKICESFPRALGGSALSEGHAQTFTIMDACLQHMLISDRRIHKAGYAKGECTDPYILLNRGVREV